MFLNVGQVFNLSGQDTILSYNGDTVMRRSLDSY